MSISVKIPTPLRTLTGGLKEVISDGTTIFEIIDDLETKYPGIKERLCDERGELRRFVNIYVGGEDIRFVDGMGTAVKDGSDVSIVPAVAGG